MEVLAMLQKKTFDVLKVTQNLIRAGQDLLNHYKREEQQGILLPKEVIDFRAAFADFVTILHSSATVQTKKSRWNVLNFITGGKKCDTIPTTKRVSDS